MCGTDGLHQVSGRDISLPLCVFCVCVCVCVSVFFTLVRATQVHTLCFLVRVHTHTHTHTHTQRTQARAHTHTYTHSLSLSLSHTHTHAHTQRQPHTPPTHMPDSPGQYELAVRDQSQLMDYLQGWTGVLRGSAYTLARLQHDSSLSCIVAYDNSLSRTFPVNNYSRTCTCFC
jgi:hypothetical protein